jgi:hypothetical protein
MQVQMLKNSQPNAVFGFLTVGFALPLYLLLLSGFPTVDALKVCAMILVQIVSGALIWAQVMHPRPVDIVEGVGMGLAIGSIFAVIGHQIFLPTSLREFGWLLPVLIAVITSVTWRSTKGSHKNFVLEDASGLLFVAFAVVLILKQWWWLSPLAFCGCLTILAISKKKILLPHQFPNIWISVALIFILATLSILYLRQINLNWWIRSWDITYFESKSYSIAQLGHFKNIQVLGYPMDYHWFGLAWVGLTAVICDLEPFLSIAQVAPIYSTIVIGCLIWAIGKNLNCRTATRYAILFVFSFATAVYSPANTPNITSMIWFFGSFLVIEKYFARSQLRLFVILGVIAIAALGAKVSAGFTVLTAFILTDLWMSAKRRKNLVLSILRSSLLIIAALLVYYLVIGGPNRLGNNQPRIDFRQLSRFYGVEKERHFVIHVIGSVGTLLGLFPLYFLALSTPLPRRVKTGFKTFISLGIFMGLLPTIVFDDEAISYFLKASNVFATVGLFTLFVKADLMFEEFKKRQKDFLTIAMYSVVFHYFFVWLKNQVEQELTFLRGGVVPVLVFAEILYFVAIFNLICFHKSFAFRQKLFTKLQQMSILLLFNFCVAQLISFTIEIPKRLQEASFEISPAGSSIDNLGTDWIRTNTKVGDVLATNRFCREKAVDECFEPKYSLLSANSRRQILIEAPYYIAYGGDDESLYPVWVKERLDLSRGFADGPTAEIAARLRELGVDWFYLFLDNTENRNWAPYATVEYQNSEVAILKLVDPNS